MTWRDQVLDVEPVAEAGGVATIKVIRASLNNAERAEAREAAARLQLLDAETTIGRLVHDKQALTLRNDTLRFGHAQLARRQRVTQERLEAALLALLVMTLAALVLGCYAVGVF